MAHQQLFEGLVFFVFLMGGLVFARPWSPTEIATVVLERSLFSAAALNLFQIIFLDPINHKLVGGKKR